MTHTHPRLTTEVAGSIGPFRPGKQGRTREDSVTHTHPRLTTEVAGSIGPFRPGKQGRTPTARSDPVTHEWRGELAHHRGSGSGDPGQGVRQPEATRLPTSGVANSRITVAAGRATRVKVSDSKQWLEVRVVGAVACDLQTWWPAESNLVGLRQAVARSQGRWRSCVRSPNLVASRVELGRAAASSGYRDGRWPAILDARPVRQRLTHNRQKGVGRQLQRWSLACDP